MPRSLKAFAGFFLVLLAAAPASAQGFGRGWFEKWSGPGPFAGLEIDLPVGCRWDTSHKQKFYWFFQAPIGMAGLQKGGSQDPTRPVEPLTEADTRRLCIDFEYTSATNQDSSTSGLIDLRLVEGRVGFPLESKDLPYWLAAFEPQIAAGAMRLKGDDFGEWRFTLSPQITIKPLKFIPRDQARVGNVHKRGDWRSLVQISYGAILITPGVTNDDLQVAFLEPFDHGWLQRVTWIRVDASELFGIR